MKKLGMSLLVGTAAAVLVTVTAMPASAAMGDTVTTFDLTPGAITVAVSGTAALTTSGATTTTAAHDVVGSLGPVTVTDLRGSVLAWNVSAISTQFVGQSAVAPSASTDVVYSSGAGANPSGTATFTTSGTGSILTSTEVFNATAVSGNNAVTFTPTITVTMPAGALSDTYSGTVTTSVL